MVCFHDNPEKYNNPAMLHKIDQEVKMSDSGEGERPLQININILFPLCLVQMLKCIELDEKLKSMDQEITVNPQFVQKVRKYLKENRENQAHRSCGYCDL